MTMQIVGPLLPWPFPSGTARTPAMGNVVIDATGEIFAMQLNINRTGNIRTLGFSFGSITAGDTIDVRLETDAGGGQPTGTLSGTNTNKTVVIAGTDDNLWFDNVLTADAAVTGGQIRWFCIAQGSGGGNMQINKHDNTNFSSRFPIGQLFTGTWTKQTGLLNASVGWDDGNFYPIPGVLPAISYLTTTFNTANNPDEYGNRFNVVAPQRWSGVALYGDIDTPGAVAEIILYDTDGTTALSTITFDHDSSAVAGGGFGFYYIPFPTPVTLAVANGYRITVKPDASNTSLAGVNVNINAHFGMYPMGVGCYSTSRNNNGSWTDLNTRRYWIMPVPDGFDDATGGGGQSVGIAGNGRGLAG